METPCYVAAPDPVTIPVGGQSPPEDQVRPPKNGELQLVTPRGPWNKVQLPTGQRSELRYTLSINSKDKAREGLRDSLGISYTTSLPNCPPTQMWTASGDSTAFHWPEQT